MQGPFEGEQGRAGCPPPLPGRVQVQLGTVQVQLGSPGNPNMFPSKGHKLMIIAPSCFILHTCLNTLATVILSPSYNNQLHFLSQSLSFSNNWVCPAPLIQWQELGAACLGIFPSREETLPFILCRLFADRLLQLELPNPRSRDLSPSPGCCVFERGMCPRLFPSPTSGPDC